MNARAARRRILVWGSTTAVLIVSAVCWDGWVARTQLPPLTPDVSVVVEARSGKLLRGFTVADGRWRLPVKTNEVSKPYLRQLIAFEDKRFYSHGGVDILAAFRAISQAVRNGEVVSGGSTLTMQVARLLEDSGTGSWRGKIRQMRVAWALERVRTKDEILELYLRIAPFGGNIEGVRAASLSYFRKEPIRLTEAEAALLVALPQSPEARRPDRAPERAKAARDRVLARGVEAGVLTRDGATAAKREAVPTQRYAFDFLAPHISERVMAAAPAVLRHRLTLDHEMQAKAEALLAHHVQGRHAALSGAIMVVDHHTGAVLVTAGSPDYLDAGRQGFVDMTRAVRSPGSTLKPLIYGLAFDAGFAHPETIVTDGPIRFGPYAPQNFDNSFRGQVRVREALQLSLNIPAVTMLDAIEPSVLMARMKRAGASPKLPSGRAAGLAIALGGVGLRLTDLMAIYASLARGGEAVPLVYDLSAEQDIAVRPPVISRVAAWYVSDILSGVTPPVGAVSEGVAYKTGTSYGHRDAWAIGFDGQHTIGVWLGRADGAAMPGELGAELAAPVLFDVFAAIKPKLDPLMGPPDGALTVTNAQLPTRLKVYRRPGSVGRTNLPEITFPPDGARLVLFGEDSLVAKVDRGVAPFTWLANGVPVVVESFERQADVKIPGPGFLSISVIDATGYSQAVRVIID